MLILALFCKFVIFSLFHKFPRKLNLSTNISPFDMDLIPIVLPFCRDGKGDILNYEKETSSIMQNQVRLGKYLLISYH